jgi:hypothetical protein
MATVGYMCLFYTVFRVRDLGSSFFLTLESDIRDPGRTKNGSGNRDKHTGSYSRELRVQFLGLKNLNSLLRIRFRFHFEHVSRMEKFIRIRDKHPGATTLVLYKINLWLVQVSLSEAKNRHTARHITVLQNA